MVFFELLALAWTLSSCTCLGILSFLFSGEKTKERLRLGQYGTFFLLGPIGLASVLTSMWYSRQECLEQIVTSLKKKP